MKFLIPLTITGILMMGGITQASLASNQEITQITVPEGMIEENMRTTPNDSMIVDGVEILGSGEIAPTYAGE